MTGLRKLVIAVARTPFHPQWLLGPRRPPMGLEQATGFVLDLGAADRWLAPHLPKQVQYVALDFPATGRDMYGAQPDVFADGARLPFFDNAFDGVVCLEVIEHVPDPAIVIAEIARVLRPGGRVWLSMPFLYPVHDAPFDFQRYTEHGLRRDLQRADLKVERLHKTGHAIRTVGLLTSLAMAGGVYRGGWRYLLTPIAALSVLLINCVAYAASFFWPDWDAIGLGYEVLARKP
jgi:SAM-dependent methyltransferase